MGHDHDPIKGILLDLDGVLWRGKEPIAGAGKTVARLKEQGYRVRFVSNNSILGIHTMREHFANLGIPAEPGDIVLATEVLAKNLARKQSRATVYLIGSSGFRHDLEAQGLRVIDEPEEIDYLTDFVVVGGDRNINFDKFTRALRCLQKGAVLAVPNTDITFPAEGGLLLPGTGALVAAVSAMAGKEPEIMIGKPKPDLLLAAAQDADLSPAECIMVGDTVATDIQAAHAARMRSVLVLTGNTTEADVAGADPAPWRVLPSVANIFDLLGG